MQLSRFLSSTSVSLAGIAIAALASGCGDDTCGPPSGTHSAGLLASSADVVLNFGNITSGQNNDCPASDAPAGVISLTLEGTQVEGPGLLTLCIPRPDKLNEGVPLGVGNVQIIDLHGEVDGCTYAFESARPVTGTASSQGLCDNGANAAGFALTIDGAISLRRMCPTMNDTIAVTFAGTVAVTPRQ